MGAQGARIRELYVGATLAILQSASFTHTAMASTVTISSVSSRDIVVASALLITGSALVPLAEVVTRVSSACSGAVPTTESLRALAALTTLDRYTLLACVAFVGLALSLVFANASIHPPKKAASALRMSAASLTVVTLATALLLVSILIEQQYESLWHPRLFTQREDVFEARVNDVYCHVKGAQVCQFGSLAEAREVFPLRSWPVGATTQPGKSIHSSCEGFDESVRQWGYPVKMELCRLCHTITKEEQLGGEELLAAVQDISLEELQWCGAYLVDDERATTLHSDDAAAVIRSVGQQDFQSTRSTSDSPYRKHRVEFQQLLSESLPVFTLTLGVRALGALVACAVPCLLALFYSLLRVTHTRTTATATQDKA